MLRFLLGASCALALGCSGAQFGVRTRRPDGQPAPGATLRLIGVHEDVCSDAALLIAQTDQAGAARLATEWCGPARVIAVAGSTRGESMVNTCDEATVSVLLHAPPAGSTDLQDGGAVEALAFVKALSNADWEAARLLVAQGEPIDAYREADGGLRRASSASFARVPPRAWWYVRRRGNAGRAQVTLALLYDDGCEQRAQVDLVHTAEGWRVTGLELRPLSAP